MGAVIAVVTLGLAGSAAAQDTPEAAFARANEHLKANRLKEAADGLRRIAVGSPDHPLGRRAAMLYLDAQNALLGAGNGRALNSTPAPEALSAFRAAAQEVQGIYCSPAKKTKADPELCPLLVKIHRDMMRLDAESRLREFDQSGGKATELAKEAADIYLSIWKSYGEAPCKAMEPSCERMDEILYNAARALQAARMAPESIQARMILLDPRYNLSRTELARRSVWEIAQIYQGLGEYAEAATWLERFARENKAMERAPEALSDLVILRLALGQRKEAEEAVALFNKNYGSKSVRHLAELELAVASSCAERGDFAGAARILKGSLSSLDLRGGPDTGIRARALLGQSLAALGDEASAEKHYKGVLSASRDPELADRIRRQSPDDARRLGQVLTAVGEAQFFLAELDRKKQLADPIPAYKGPADLQAMAKFIKDKTIPALSRRTNAIEALEKRYLGILQIAPVPPPKWVVAAAAQVAAMWVGVVEEARALKIESKPAKPAAGGMRIDAEREVRSAIDAELEPVRARAKAASRACLSYSVKLQHTSEASKRCEAWLTRNYPKEFPRIEELAPAPSRITSGAPLVEPAEEEPKTLN
jgi:tetratricopeptide (TPR) repeat protein